MHYNKRVWSIIKDAYTYKKVKVSLYNDFCYTSSTHIPKVLKNLNHIRIYRGKSIKDIKSFQQLYGFRIKFLNKNGSKN